MEQKVYFDNEGKLQITTDNGKIMDNGATTQTKIEGTFTIDAEDVAKLLTMMSGKVTCARETYYWGQRHAFYLATDENFAEAVEHEKYLEKELDIQRDKVKRLTRKIEEQMIIVASLAVKSKSRTTMTKLLDALRINIDFLSSEATDDMKLSVLRDSREIINQMIEKLCENDK